jgi:LPXTG-motif cell wall-anchored protein
MAGRCNESGECDWRESALAAAAIGVVGLLAGVVVWRRRRRA